MRYGTTILAFGIIATCTALAALAADPYSIPKVERGPDPASQTIGKKSCGQTWIPYDMPCSLTNSITERGPERFPTDQASIERAARESQEQCDKYEPLNKVEDKRGIAHAAEPKDKDSFQPWRDIGKARGMTWGCYRGSLDYYLLQEFALDSCARGLYTSCKDVPGNAALSGSVPERFAALRGLQRELNLPEVMLVSESDCSGALREQTLRSFGKGPPDDRRLDTLYWLKCAIQGRAATWGLAIPVTVELCNKVFPNAKHPYPPDQRCERGVVTVRGKQVEIKDWHFDNVAGVPALSVFGRGLGYLGECDSRIADEAASATSAKVPWKKKHLEMLREHCLIAAAMIANPDVSGWAQSVASKFDLAISRLR